MWKKIILLSLVCLLMSGCTYTKDFKRAKIQAEFCEDNGRDYKFNEEGTAYIPHVVCVEK